MGEKCGECGALDVATILAAFPTTQVPGAGCQVSGKARISYAPALFKCLACGHRWEEGSEKPTHGICDFCLVLARQPEATIAHPGLCAAGDNHGRPHRMHAGRCLCCGAIVA